MLAWMLVACVNSDREMLNDYWLLVSIITVVLTDYVDLLFFVLKKKYFFCILSVIQRILAFIDNNCWLVKLW